MWAPLSPLVDCLVCLGSGSRTGLSGLGIWFAARFQPGRIACTNFYTYTQIIVKARRCYVETCPWVIHLNEIAISVAAFLAVSIRRLRENAECQLRHDSSNSFQASKPSAARNSWVNSDLKSSASLPTFSYVFDTIAIKLISKLS